jgi:uncharacterized protein with von Willebrand factor type A (vWA) domain
MRAFGVETIELDLPPLTAGFARRLRDAGLPVTPDRAAAFAGALALVRPISRRRLYWTARSVFVSDQAHARIFDRVFSEVFGAAEADGEPPAGGDTQAAPADERAAADRGDDATRAGRSGGDGEAEPGGDEAPLLALASDEERLAGKRFDALEPGELAQLYRLMTRIELATPLRRTRRHERGRGRSADLRRTLRDARRTGGEPLRLARRRRRVEPRRLVLLCDISGSMEPYARAYLQFLTCAASAGPDAEAFVFATRLTRITRALASRNPERAIQRAAEAAPDWSSGTRIGDALKAFNDRHGRRGMARGAVVVILSDGWERGDPALVGREMQRLSRLAHRIVWVNPRMSAGIWAPRAGGMKAALPHCDALVSGHNFRALGDVVDAIGGAPVEAPGPAPVDEPETWASATPVPGSSVAMPSGHGPSRGNTSPGWVTDE